MNNKQEILLKIVRSWNIKNQPEYRRFRCANCQKYLHKAWHYWRVNNEYITPVHFCRKCNSNLKSLKINIVKAKTSIDKKKFGLKLIGIEEELKRIINSWNIKAKPTYKQFFCDYCKRNIRKAYHFWFKFKKDTLFETHFCKKCGNKLGFNILR